MQNNRPDSIRFGVYELIDFNYYIPTIEKNLIDHLYDSEMLDNAKLKNISSLVYYEIINTFINLDSKSQIIPVFSKFTHETELPFCTTLEFEKSFFQKIRRLSNLISFKAVINEYLTFMEYAKLPIPEKEEKMIHFNKIKNLKLFYKFLEDNNMSNLVKRIKNDSFLKSKFLLNH
jgi:hypothetical protein